MASADEVFEIISHSHSVEVAGGVVKPFLGSDVRHCFMGKVEDFAPDVVSFMGCFIGNIWTVLTVILPSFKKRFVN